MSGESHNNQSAARVVIPLLAVCISLLVAVVGWTLVSRDRVFEFRCDALEQQIQAGDEQRIDIEQTVKDMQRDINRIQLDVQAVKLGQEQLLKEIRKVQ
jgi:peptidoglycan hydrolase CwlO-like protein